MNEQTKADLIFYTDLYVDAGYDYEEAERMAKDLLRVIGVISGQTTTNSVWMFLPTGCHYQNHHKNKTKPLSGLFFIRIPCTPC